MASELKCSVEECPRLVFSRGWCQVHYAHWQRHRDPLHWAYHRPLGERFWEKVARADGEGCWEWQAYRDARGYGCLRVGGRAGKTVKAHRVAWELTNGDIPEGMSVCHRCDNPPCVRPSHLFLESHQGNMRDKASKGRAFKFEREANPSAKLTNEQVEALVAAYRAGGVTQRELGRRFGVTQAAVSWIMKHRAV